MHHVVLSFPKSGRTWVRLFLGAYAERAGIVLPGIVFAHDDWKCDKRLLLLRDYPDLLVSYYFEKTVRERVPLEMDIHTFIRHPLFGVQAVNECYERWLAYDGEQKVIHYEDLFNPIWGQILEYFDIPVDEDAIKASDEECQIGNVRKNIHQFERRKDAWRYLPTSDDPESHKFRRGKVGGYVDYLTQEDIDYIQTNRLIGG
ncbi:MAG: sulfotransferase domain-containing protein [Planctomycetota bacterium]